MHIPCSILVTFPTSSGSCGILPSYLCVAMHCTNHRGFKIATWLVYGVAFSRLSSLFFLGWNLMLLYGVIADICSS
ncbi:hypothetical protein BDW66DRAFT_123731 [Aspergillus desertorum]